MIHFFLDGFCRQRFGEVSLGPEGECLFDTLLINLVCQENDRCVRILNWGLCLSYTI